MFKHFLFVVLLLSGLPAAVAQGQTDYIVRPRRTQNPPSVTGQSDRQAPSSEARAEAKRLYKAGVKYGTSGLFKQAAESFEQALKLNPDYSDAYFSLGHAYYDLGQWEDAIDTLLRGLALKPKDKEGQDRLAQSRMMLERETANREDKSPAGNGGGGDAKGSRASLRSTAPLAATSKPPANDLALTDVYRVGPGDVLEVRLSEDASAQSTRLTVTSAGLLEHPDLSAPVPGAGLTVEEISARIEDDLQRRSSTARPNVSVGVHEYVSHRILVSGLVKEPGTKIIKREAIPLYVVVADAQPLSEAGQISVLRNESNQSYVIDLLAQSEMNLLVRPGDVITLQPMPTQFFYLSGEVNSPGEKTFRRGLTLTQAIIVAGGLSKNAKEARLARDDGTGFLVMSRYKLKDIDSGKIADPAIKPGDRITIE
ncbi:MAG TPA: tetratricopeptide repeat protein [Pyrinomonadaceae bacterium]|nr:tetratricopeptide repeat protein [Pyrinomonadaceae bacterium]